MRTKTEIKIMKLFTSAITLNFSLTDVSKLLGLQYKSVHRTIKLLIEAGCLTADNKRYSLNYKEHHAELAYVEHLRSEEFLAKPEHGTLSLFISDVLEKVKDPQFILIIFGSTVTEAKPRDVDMLIIVNHLNKVEPMEKQLHTIGNMFTLKFDVHVISHESVYEMLEKRDQVNVINQLLNKHVIVQGAHLFYWLLTQGRK